jgi:MFS transporter, DHA1 family, tetracycline resistance protein
MASTTRIPATSVSAYPIFAVNFVGTLGFSVVLPFLVFLVTRWGGNGFVYGVIGATYSAFQLVGAPVLGRLSDAVGRRRVLLLSQLGTALSWGIFVIAFWLPDRALAVVDSDVLGHFSVTWPLIAVFVARACDGATGGNISVANAYLADITDEESRGANFGRMAVAANLGFILGPAIAVILGGTRFGELGPVLAALVISLVATLLILFWLPEVAPCVLTSDPRPADVARVLGQEQKHCFEIAGARKPGLRSLLRLESVSLLLAVYFLVMLGFNLYYVSFPVYAATSLHWSGREIGIYYAVMSLLMATVQGPLLGRATRVWGDRALAIAGSLILAASFLFFTSRHAAWIYAGVVLLALGNGLMWPSVVSLLSLAAGRARQGAVQGLAGSAGAIASILGLLVGGVLYASVGSLVFSLASLTILAVFLLTLRLPAGPGHVDRIKGALAR